MKAEDKETTYANGIELNEGDKVYTYDYDTDGLLKKYHGILHKNIDHPEVSEWYVKYDDGNDCAVLDFGQIFKSHINQ